ncbi:MULTISPECIES: LysR substrate-binding domain-containing protein [unclassified Beijerinckia]|uniref:LysR substrate-binding domain-containing protein n=1 Tax=unclassified Beijerinckia TaxID=2638183 RepID=UPI000896B31C|nr:MULTISPECIES: LysR substrate-binding domain-containing protein [unclassified Beijerinckia]MDH7799005.1 DNA-binding transcriptional LysR family regulator [Beijerinckia sp. GAS462]SED84612.1 transcriptional regulator, LysR family [Beijerinckia sp. 28-YEA-48]
MSSLLDLRRLRYFVAVAEELHFRRAAERLRMSQPPLSLHIQALEQELNLKLFERTKQRVLLTPAGRGLLERARRILAEVESTRAELQAVARGEGGELRIGFTESAGLEPFFHRALHDFRRSYPGVRLILQDTPSLHQIEALHRRELDLGILRKPPGRPTSEVTVELLRENALVAAMHESNPLAGERRISIAQLRNEPFITYPRDMGISLFQHVFELATAADFFPNIVHETRNSVAMMGMIAAGLGVAIVPDGLRRIALDGVCFIDLKEVAAKSGLYVAYRSTDETGASAILRRLLLDLARSSRLRKPRQLA